MSFGRGMAVGKAITCVPHFDRPVIRSGDDLRTIGREGDGADQFVVGADFGCLELQST